MLKVFLINIFLRKGGEDMHIIYATLIIKGSKKFSEVPEILKEKVREVLVDLDCEYLAE